MPIEMIAPTPAMDQSPLRATPMNTDTTPQSPTISHWTTLRVTFFRAFAHLSEGTTMKTHAIFASCFMILFGGSLAAAEQSGAQEQPQQAKPAAGAQAKEEKPAP